MSIICRQIAFEPSQIKRIDNLTPTGSKDIRYSLADFEKNPLEYGRKKKHNKRSRYNEGETLFLRWENGNTPVGEVKKFRRFGKIRYYEKTADGCIELSYDQFAERSGANYVGAYRGEDQKADATFEDDGDTGGKSGRDSGGNRNAERAEPLYRQALGEELRDDTGRGIRGDGGSSGRYTAGGSGLALTENEQEKLSLVEMPTTVSTGIRYSLADFERNLEYGKKEASNLIGAGVQFPTQLQAAASSTGIVRYFPEKVNMKVLKQT